MGFWEALKSFFTMLTEFLTLSAADSGVSDIVTTQFPAAVNKILESSNFSQMYEIMIPVGISLAAVFVSIDLIEKASMEMLTVEKIIFMFVKLFISFAIISNGIIIFKGLNALSEYIVELMSSALGGATAAFDPIDAPTFGSVGGAVFSFIVALFKILSPTGIAKLVGEILVTVFITLLLPIAAYQRAIRIGYYCLASPIVLADTAGKGVKTSHCMNFLFGLLRNFLEYPVVWFGMILAFDLSANMELITLVIVLTTILFKSKSFIKTLV